MLELFSPNENIFNDVLAHISLNMSSFKPTLCGTHNVSSYIYRIVYHMEDMYVYAYKPRHFLFINAFYTFLWYTYTTYILNTK